MNRTPERQPAAMAIPQVVAGGPPRSLDDPQVIEAVEAYFAALEAGERPDRHDFLARYPDVAVALAACLDNLEFIQTAAPQLNAAAVLGPTGQVDSAVDLGAGVPLGDFRLFREIGRGGMGVVYEAEQLSLGRRVALKVLPFAAGLDAKQLQRFKNEAHAAGHLHHTNIVPVYAVGCERGIHYYAMQFIDGQSLAAMIQELRCQAGLAVAPETASPGASALAKELASGHWAPARRGLNDPEATGPYDLPAKSSGDETTLTVAVAPSTDPSTRSPAFFRTAAHLGVMAAEALEHAHQLGVVHRDIKPANLLVDMRGNLWITDYGLAHVQSQAGLTMTGDLIGTLRYMSPEQALAKRVIVDHRTDIYSLGATLYELLTLEPVFPGSDRQELLRQIAFEEPRPPRRLNKAIPRELETIVLKAMEKNPADRYATAQELADDLQRHLKDEPILAKRPTLAQRVRKWARRHRPAVRAAAVVLMATLLLVCVGAWRRQREQTVREAARAVRRAETEHAVTAAATEARTHLADGDKQMEYPQHWREAVRLARLAVERAEGFLDTEEASEEMAELVRQVRADVDAADRDSRVLVELENIQLDQVTVNWTDHDYERLKSRYAAVFKEYSVDPTEPEKAAAQISDSRIRDALGAALMHYSAHNRGLKGSRWLEKLIKRTDPNRADFFESVLAANDRQDHDALLRLAAELETPDTPIATLVIYTRFFRVAKKLSLAERLLRVAQERKPGDFWLNHDLGRVLLLQGDARAAEAVGYFRAALAARDDSAAAYNLLGAALWQTQDQEGAIRCYQTALRIDPNWAPAHINLGIVLAAQHKWEKAIAEYRKAIDIDPHLPHSYNSLAAAYVENSNFKDAKVELEKAIERDPENPIYHTNLANVLIKLDQWDEAFSEYHEALRWDPNYTVAHYFLANALVKKGDFENATVAYLDAIQLKRDFVPAQKELAVPLLNLVLRLPRSGDPKAPNVRRAVELAQRAVALAPDQGTTWLALGMAQYRAENWQAARENLDKGIVRRQGGDSADWFFLAMAYRQSGDKAKAEQCYEKANLWMEKHYQPAFPRFRAEAAFVLERIVVIKSYQGHENAIHGVALSGDGGRALTGSFDGTLRLWNVESGKEERLLKGHTGWVTSVALTADGSRALSGSYDKTVRLWDVEKEKEIRQFPGPTQPVECVAFSPDGKLAAAGGQDKTLRIWEVDTGKEVHCLTGHEHFVRCVAFSPDGKQVLSGSFDKTLRLWSVETGKELRQFKGHTDAIACVAYSGDGSRILSGSLDKTLRLWNAKTSEEVRRFENHASGIECLALSADGRRVVCGGDNATARVWDVETGKELYRFDGHEAGVWAVVFTPDGTRVLSACAVPSPMLLWELPDNLKNVPLRK